MAITKDALKSGIHAFLDGIANQIASSALKGVPLVGDLDLPVGQAVFASLLPLIDRAIETAGSAVSDLVNALNDIPGIRATLQGGDIAIHVDTKQVLSLADESFQAGAAAAGIGLALGGQFKTSLTAALNADLRVDGTSGDVWIVNPGQTKELSLQLKSDLGIDAGGKLGFIDIGVKDAKPGAPEVLLSADIDLPAGTLANAFRAPPKPVFAGTAGLDLAIETKVADGKLPSIGTELVMAYDLAARTSKIAFKDVTLDIGSLLRSFSAPFGVIDTILGSFPLGIILDIATGRLPVVDDLAHKTGLDALLDVVPSIRKDGKVTLADLAVIADSLKNSGGIGKFFDGLATLALIRELAKGLSTGTLHLGDFDVTADPSKSIDSFLGLLPAEAKAAFDDIARQLGGGDGLSSKGGLSIPILDDPSLIVKLLLNKVFPDPVTIVQYDLPDLGFGYHTYTDFPIIGPLGLTLEGDAAVGIDIGVGYDSAGFKTGRVEDGVFVTNFDAAGRPSTGDSIASLNAGIHAGVVLNAVVLRASATGGINFLVDAYLRDTDANPGDGKLRLSQSDGFSIRPEGKAIADVRVRVTLGFGIFSYTKTIPIVSVVLVDFSLSGNGKAPTSPVDRGLATLTGDRLELNTGPRAAIRILNGVRGNDGTDLEGYRIAYAVDPKTNAVVSGALAVSAFGTTQTFGAPGAGPLAITGNLGERDDSLVLSADVTQAIDVHGGAGDDMIVGGAGADRIYGDAGTNYLVGNGGDDLLQGGDGADTLVGGAGADRLFGGGGIDEVSYAEAAQTVGVKLLKVPGIAEISGFGGEAEGDRLTGIDHLTGTRYADELTADDDASNAARAPRTLEGLGGDDKLYGGAGDDLLIGGAGGDLLSGGGGRNGTSYVTSFGSVVVDLGAKAYYGGDATGDWLENIQEVYGSAGNDTITGDGADNRLNGFFGNDVLSGGGGKDVVEGDLGDDTVYGGLDGDTLNGDAEKGVARRGVDLLSYRNYRGGRVTVDLKAGTAGNGNPFRPATDTIVGARVLDANGNLLPSDGYSSFENLEGSTSNLGDSLTGDDGDNVIWGLAGNDRINGGAGNDRLIGGAGSAAGSGDTIDGGDGIDWAEYQDSTAGVTVYLDGRTGAAFDGTANGAATSIGDVITNVENLLGSDQSDNLYGNSGDNIIDPGLTGTERSYDSVSGGGGRDVLRLDYSRGDFGSGAVGGFQWHSTTNGSVSRRNKAGDVVLDAVTFSGISSLWFTGTRMADAITGGQGDDVLVGGGGDDWIGGGLGNDVIDAGSGDDTVTYGTDRDGDPANQSILPNFRMDGGSGIDRLKLRLIGPGFAGDIAISGADPALGDFDGVNAVFSNGSAISNFEVLWDVWTGGGNDTVTQAGRVDNVLRTGDGNDIIRPGLGFDTVSGGFETAGLRQAPNGGSYDNNGPNYDIVDFGAFQTNSGDTLYLDYSSLTDASVRADQVRLFSANLYAPGTYFGGTYIPGVSGTLYYNDVIYSTVANADGTTVANRLQSTSVDNINVKGSKFDDVLVGTDVDFDHVGGYKSGFEGGYVYPTYYKAYRGRDVLEGGAGNDQLFGQSGDDQLYGGDGNDVLQGSGQWYDDLQPYVSRSTYDVAEIDRLVGGRGADTFVLGLVNRSSDPAYSGQFSLYMEDGRPNESYAVVADFKASEGDVLRLAGNASWYSANVTADATLIFYNVPASASTPAHGDLIAVLNGVTDFSLTAPYVKYVNASDPVTTAAVAAAPPARTLAASSTRTTEAPAAASAPATPAAAPAAAVAGSWVTQEADPAALLAKLGAGSGVVAGSQSLTIEGSGEGFGTFDGDPFGLGSGIVLSTGRVEDLAKPNTVDRPSGPLSRTIQLTFTKIGRAGGSDIFRADLSNLGIDINSLRISDAGTRRGGSGGIASGFDLDSFVLSTKDLRSVDANLNLNDPTVLPRLDAFAYDNAHLFYRPGNQYSPDNGIGFGRDLVGSLNGLVTNSIDRLSQFSAADSGTDFSKALTLGASGSLGVNLKTTVSSNGPLYLYVGEYGGSGEAVTGEVTLSSDTIQPAGDLSTDLGAPGLAGDTSRMTYSFTPVAGTDLVTFQVVLFSEELPEHAGILDPDAVKVTLNGVSIAALSDGAAADLATLMRSATGPTHKDLVLNAPGSGPLAGKVSADAYTKTLTFVGRVQAGAQNTLVVEAADTRDAYLDTGILIKGGTFLASGGSLPTNAAPFAVADVAAVAYGTAYTGNVLANDIDPNGDALKASLATGPTNGTVTLAADGRFTYTPKAGFFGSDSFTYLANDGKANGAPGTVVLVVGRPAGVTADAGNPYAAVEDTPLAVAAYAGVLAGDTTTTGKPLTAQLVSTTRNGTLALKADGSFLYTPKANFSGTDSFVYRATDGTASSGNVTVVIDTAGQNDAPTLAIGAPSASLVEAGVSPSNVALPGTSTATIRLSVADVDGAGTAGYDTTGWTAAGAGKVSKSGLYGTAVLTTATGVLAYTLDNARGSTDALAAGASALDGFDIVVRDTQGATTTRRASFTVIGANDAPSLGVGPQSLTLVEAGIAPNGAGLLGTEVATIDLTRSDPDAGDVVTFQSAGWTAAGAGKLSKRGTYGSVLLDTATGVMTYTLDNDRPATMALAAGATVTDSFAVTVKDAAGASVTRNVGFAIQGTADPLSLVVGSPSRTVVEAGTGIAGTPTATIALAKSGGSGATGFVTAGWTALGGTRYGRGGTFGSVVLDTATGVLTYTLDNGRGATNDLEAGDSRTDGFTVTARDAAGHSVTKIASFVIGGSGDGVTINGSAGNDLVSATSGIAGQPLPTKYADTILGNNGDDRLAGLGGKDVIDGGAGIDTADYSEKTAAVAVTLNGATGVTVTVGGAAEDTIRNIENLVGGSGNDTFTGDAQNNVFSGQAGSDVLDGGAGSDTADYAEKTAAVVAALNGATAVAVSVGGVAEDRIRNIENLVGGSAGDRFTGDGLANTFAGRGGRDVLDGGAGSDTADYAEKTAGIAVTLNGATGVTVTVGGIAEDTIRNIENVVGGAGGDRLTGDGLANGLFGNGGNDVLGGGGGRDLLDGGAGSDTADYAEKTAAVAVTLRGASDASVTVGGIAEDTVRNVENLVGGSAGDTFVGDGLANTFAGRGGRDLLDGGGGIDTADYAEKTAAVAVTLNGATNAVVTVGGIAEDTIRNIENLVGGAAGDTFTGDGLANVFAGRGGKDVLDGGGGADTADYSEKTAAVAVRLNGSTNAAVTVGGIAEDTLRNIENLVGGSAGDAFTGDAFANTFAGRGGRDVLDGGGGIDTADYSEKTAAVAVTLNGAANAVVVVGGIAEDTIRNIETILGGSAGDILIGDALANSLFGQDGNDSLRGGGGKDVLDGGRGVDTADYGDKTAAVAVALNGATPATVTVGGVAEDTILNIENLVGGAAGDTLTGDASANTLAGRGGRDILDGGAGSDTADYSEKTAAVSVTLGGASYATVTVGGVAEDTIRNIENLVGGSAGDRLTGDGFATILTGNAGDDLLDGGFGNDVLTGGVGADRFVFSTSLDASSNVDTISDFNVADDTIQLSRAIFGALGAGNLPAASFGIGSSAATAGQVIVYDRTNGRLFYDADGSGAGAQVQFASLAPNLALTAADFRVA